MAGDWIKMRGNLWDDPRVARLCDLTDSGEASVIGGLYWLWATADQHSSDGVMPGLTLRSIDRKTGVAGFGDALVSVGWLFDEPDGVRIPRFEEHNGSSAKNRAQTAKRVANHRGNADVTQTPLQKEHVTVSSALAREEKRREEKKEPKSKAAHTVVSVPEHEEVPDALPDFQSTLTPEQKAVIPLVTKLRSLGVTVTSSNPLAVEWARKGLTLANAVELVEITRGRGKDGPIHPNYFTTLIDDFMKPKAPKPRIDDWYRSDAGIQRKASELGVYARPGDSFAQLRERCESEIRKREGVAA